MHSSETGSVMNGRNAQCAVDAFCRKTTLFRQREPTDCGLRDGLRGSLVRRGLRDWDAVRCLEGAAMRDQIDVFDLESLGSRKVRCGSGSGCAGYCARTSRTSPPARTTRVVPIVLKHTIGIVAAKSTKNRACAKNVT